MSNAVPAHLDPTVRHDIVFYFDVTDGNPNGDPDSGNRPRTDLDTQHGLVTDVALKRKIRNTLALAGDGDPRYGIFVEAGHALNTRLLEAASANGAEDEKISTKQITDTRAWLANRYVDIRLFGAVLSTGSKVTKRLGQIYGPLQVTMARSADPVSPVDHAITRVTQTKKEDIDKGESTEMGGKWTVPYGLYRAELYYSAARGRQTGVDSRDLELLYRSMTMMFDHDRSATRGRLAPRGLHVFSHQDAFGNAPAHALCERVVAERTEPDNPLPPRSFTDYKLRVDSAALPDGVTLTTVLG
ncbi:type I-C CRISPR-associated protein Cas7/Csd2 [Actinoalloteichus spitiensis]|uniref:type I-C CRISPR-associated protein Cas7/Csd2 n=1 Tax=Actinoalloteichus spitiensis TaxID=252394 RepID=UPI000374F3E8|nr:type I-C CRISPR-associated protein Cas7/Csd2 [Actinoalloteichus spitiensis]